MESDQGVTVLERASVEHGLDLAERFDPDANVLVFFGETVHPRGKSRIDAAAEQNDALVRTAGRGQITLDHDWFADQYEAGFLAGLAYRDRLWRLVGVDHASCR